MQEIETLSTVSRWDGIGWKTPPPPCKCEKRGFISLFPSSNEGLIIFLSTGAADLLSSSSISCVYTMAFVYGLLDVQEMDHRRAEISLV